MFAYCIDICEHLNHNKSIKTQSTGGIMAIKTFGYCRVSTSEQNEDRQFQAMLDLGINDRDIFIDKASGKDFERPQYQALKLQLREGDVLVIKSIDRLVEIINRFVMNGERLQEILKQILRLLTCRYLIQLKQMDSSVK